MTATVAVAREGAGVMLIERYGYLGGMITVGNAALCILENSTSGTLNIKLFQKTLTTNGVLL